MKKVFKHNTSGEIALMDCKINKNTVLLHTRDEKLPIPLTLNELRSEWTEIVEDKNELKAALESLYETAIEEQIDELDFYMWLLEIGIDVEVMRYYAGEEKANHMKEFCEEHGLL